MNLPELSHLQFLILRILRGRGEFSGKRLREAIAYLGLKQKKAAFYQVMARIEAAQWVDYRFGSKRMGNSVVTEKYYKLSSKGESAMKFAANFYSEGNSPDV